MLSENETTDAPGVGSAAPSDRPYSLKEIDFFETLFAGCEGAVYLCAIEPDGPLVGERFVRSPYDFDAALRWAHEQSEAGRNVYLCPVTQPPGATGHRTKASAFELPAVFADVDPDEGR